MSETKPKKEKTYPVTSDGSPEMIDYRNKVNTGEVTKLGRPFQTAEERAAAKKKRRQYMENYYHSNRKRTRRKKRNFFEYSEARERIQAEGVRTAAEYLVWHRLNHPVRMPQSPDEYYGRKGLWTSWGDFLGVYNQFPRIPKKKWRPYKDAKAYAHSKGFTDVPSWIAYCKAGHCPDDIPHRPDVTYFTSGDWFSWREFLGPKCKIELGRAMEKVNTNVLYILQLADPRNPRSYRMGVTVGGWSAIQDAVKKYNVKFVDAYVLEPGFDWKSFILKFGEPVWDSEGSYTINNINDLVLNLSQLLIQFKRPNS